MNRIKTLAIALCAMLTICTAQAQSIVKQDATMDDYIKLLNAHQTEVGVQGDYIQRLNNAGFKTFAFDISSLKKNNYEFILPFLMKYENGESEKVETSFGYMPNFAPRLTVGISPKNDSTMQFHIYMGDAEDSDGANDSGTSRLIPFKMVHGGYHIVSTPFIQSKELKLGEFIPLMAVSSGWYDKENECVKNCDVVDFDPNNYLDTETFKKSPLIYIIGVKCIKK